jgi:hypothetical protein
VSDDNKPFSTRRSKKPEVVVIVDEIDGIALDGPTMARGTIVGKGVVATTTRLSKKNDSARMEIREDKGYRVELVHGDDVNAKQTIPVAIAARDVFFRPDAAEKEWCKRVEKWRQGKRKAHRRYKPNYKTITYN